MRGLGHRFLIAALPLCLATGGIQAQFDDNFDDDPFLSGDWIANSNWGGPTWVEAGSPLCADPNVFDPLAPCTVDETYDGYVLITDPVGNRGGNFFRSEPDSYDNFQLVVEVELRDGSLGRPADGMVVTVVGGDVPPGRLGTLGGGMGGPCVGGTGAEPSDNMLPQLAWEFDNWSCNTGDSGTPGVTGDAGGFPDATWHHVAFSYSPTGFACTDAIQPDVFVPFKTSEVPLHNKQPPPADANRFRMTVYAQRCGTDLTVACDLEAIDTGVNLGRVYTHVVPNFEPFEGFLGVTASTGGAWQNHILHSATLTTLPAGFCLQPTGEASRDITITNPDPDICGDYEPGTIANVALTIANVRPASDCCAAATNGRVVESFPANWTISGVSDSGVVDTGARTITWNLSGANFTNGKVLTYTATAGASATGIASFAGNTSDGAGGVAVFTRGESGLNPDQPFDECGRIKCWNILSALGQSGGAAPTVDLIQLDYLADGVTTELDFVFEPDAEVAPEFFGAAASTFVFSDPNGRAPNAASGIATVTKYVSPTGFVDLNNAVYGGNPDNVMTYAQIYVNSETAQDVYIASDSDDSIQILLNEEEVWINSFARGNDAGCPTGLIPPNRDRLRDVTPAPFPLNAGENRLIVKTFEGGGDFNFELRFENADGSERPVTEGLSLSHFPSNPTCRVPPASVTRAIDTGREVNGADVWSSSDTGPFDVSLTLSDIRPAGGICPAAGQVTITETVPAGWTPSNPSGGGTVNGRDVTWTLAATNGATVSYDVAPGGALGTVAFAGVITEAGSLSRYPLRGERTVLYAPAPFDKGAPSTLVDTDFDADIGICPQDWTCNLGSGVFAAGVNTEGQLQLSCDTDNASCGNGATSVLWNETVDLTSNSFTAEFDIYFAHPGAAAVGNPPADALNFVVLDADNPATMASPPTYVGAAGGGNGYANLNGFAVEFDLWANDATEPSGYNNAAQAFTHIGVTQNGTVLPHTQIHQDVVGADARPTFLGGAGWPEFVDFAGGGGVPIHIEIEYNNGNLQVWLTAPETLGPAGDIEPAYPRTRVIDTLVTFGTVGGLPVPAGQEPVLRTAWLGFTAGTGGAIFKSAVDDIAITLFPGGGPQPGGFRRGDSDSSGAVNLTDAIRILNVLFLGIGEILCLDSADSDDSGAVNLTDAIRVLNVLFLGIGEIPAPGLTNCGPDPTPDDTGCASYPADC